MSVSEHHDYSNSFEDSQASALQTLTDDLKSHLYSSLRNKGIIDSLKSQIRQKLITELSNKRHIGRDKSSQDEIKSKKVIELVANSLVADYLKRSHYDYTLSVFVPEASLTSDKVFPAIDLLQFLKINEDTDFYKHLEKLLLTSGKSFLWCVLQSLTDYYSKTSQDTNIQTDKSIPPVTYSDRMSRIDVDYENRHKQQDEQYRRKIDEKLNSYQKDLDDRYQQELKSELERFKRNELEAIRKQERDKLRKEYESRRQSIENEYKERLSNLARREREGEELNSRQRENLERESYQSRQNFLQEVNSLRERESQLRRDREQFERETKVERDRFKTIEDNLSKKEQAINEKQLAVDGLIQQEVQKMKLAEETKYVQKWKELELTEARTIEGAKMLEIEKESSRKLRDELLQRQALYEEMEIADYPAIKQENSMLKSELDSLRSRFAEVQQNYNAECQKHQIAIHERSVALKDQEDTTEENRQKSDEIKKLKDAIKSLERKLEEECVRGQKFTFRADELQKHVDLLNRENEELRHQLFQAEQVINKELHRRPLGLTPRTGRSHVHNTERETHLNQSRYSSLPQQTSLESARSMVAPSPMATPRYPSYGGQTSVEYDRSLTPPVENSEVWDDVLYETKKRLRNLDQETEQLNEYYRNFQYRIADPQTHMNYLSQEGVYQWPHSNVWEHVDQSRDNQRMREPPQTQSASHKIVKPKVKADNKFEPVNLKVPHLQNQDRTDNVSQNLFDPKVDKPTSHVPTTAVTFDLQESQQSTKNLDPHRFTSESHPEDLIDDNCDSLNNQQPEAMTEMTEGATTSRDLGPTEKHLGPPEGCFASQPETMLSMDDTWKSHGATNVYSSEEQLNTDDEDEDEVVVNLDEQWKEQEKLKHEHYKDDDESSEGEERNEETVGRYRYDEHPKSESKKDVEDDDNIDPELRKYMEIAKAKRKEMEENKEPPSSSLKEDFFDEIEEDIKIDRSDHSGERSEDNAW